MTHTANKQLGGVTVTKGRDPQNNFAIVEAFVREIQRRFRDVRGAIRATAGYENDALNLKQDAKRPLFANVDPQDTFDFETQPERIRAFMEWVEQILDEGILEPLQVSDDSSEHWTAQYIRESYVSGFQTGQGRLLQQGLSLKPDSADEILGRTIAAKELEQLYTRTYENLVDITEDMAQTIREELTQGFAEGVNPKEMANRITKELRDIEHTRAVTLARTEVAKAHSDGTIRSYREHGAEGVTHTSRLTAADTSVCPWCRRLDDVPFTFQEFQNTAVRWRGQTWRVGVPGHPNCRCSPMPEVSLDGLDSIDERLPETATVIT